ncbi:MAG TPA: glutamate--tRNA ligase family protein [Phnomibacter sp.]|nr:glutamate--tRNA ligase family protein [Phnomibacter sp.]
MKSRLAPTPSGFLHIGNLYAFAYTWLAVRKQNGQLLLRIDDIDNERSRPEYLENIFEWLSQLGMHYDQGPQSSSDFLSNWSQQLRIPLYEQMLQQLVDTGHVYACDCSRKSIGENCPNGRYAGTCLHKKIPLTQAGVNWRLHIPEGSTIQFTDQLLGPQKLKPATLIGDFIIRRRNGLPAYQIVSLADDLHFGIDHIYRGEDLLASTAAQLYMAGLLQLQSFLNASFSHHALLTNEAGEKLSKSAGTTLATPPLVNEASAKTTLAQLAQLLHINTKGKQIHCMNDLLSLV